MYLYTKKKRSKRNMKEGNAKNLAESFDVLFRRT